MKTTNESLEVKFLKNLKTDCSEMIDLINSENLSNNDLILDFFYSNDYFNSCLDKLTYCVLKYNNEKYLEFIYSIINIIDTFEYSKIDNVIHITHDDEVFIKIEEFDDCYDLTLHMSPNDIVDSNNISVYDNERECLVIHDVCSQNPEFVVDLIKQSYLL